MTPPAPRAKANPAQLLTGILSEEEQARGARMLAGYAEQTARYEAERAKANADRARYEACAASRRRAVKLAPWLALGLSITLGGVALAFGVYAAWKSGGPHPDTHVANAAGVLGVGAAAALVLAGLLGVATEYS